MHRQKSFSCTPNNNVWETISDWWDFRVFKVQYLWLKENIYLYNMRRRELIYFVFWTIIYSIQIPQMKNPHWAICEKSDWEIILVQNIHSHYVSSKWLAHIEKSFIVICVIIGHPQNYNPCKTNLKKYARNIQFRLFRHLYNRIINNLYVWGETAQISLSICRVNALWWTRKYQNQMQDNYVLILNWKIFRMSYRVAWFLIWITKKKH